LRLPAWAYAAASVAVAAVVALGIWGLRADNGNMKLGPLAPNIQADSSSESDPTSVAKVDVNPVPEFDPYPLIREDSETATLADAEDELYAMSQRSPGDLPAMLLVGDTNEQ
jgi:hypothetical protein